MKWDRQVLVKEYNELAKKIEKPTLRTFFYYLVSKNIIPNTKSAYKRLSRICVELRQRGLLPWNCFADKTRSVRGYYHESVLDYKDIEYNKERLERQLSKLSIEKLLDEYFMTYTRPLGLWAKQDYYVEIWLEKEALSDFVYNTIVDLDIPLCINRGYSSWTFIYENVERLKTYTNKKIVILYLGDLDPSGTDIERFCKEAMKYFGIQFQLKRIAITEEQVEKYGLPPRPEDIETIMKLQRDPRYKSYKKKYIVELDSLVAYAPEDFRKIIRDSVLHYFDKDKYEQVKKIHEEIKEEIKKLKREYIEKAKERIVKMIKGE